MITWIKLEPVPLKEKVFTARIESQVDQTIAQIKRSYIIPTGMEIENGGDGVLIGSDSDNQIHEAALEKIMLDYPTEWDEQAKEPKEPAEETASFEEKAVDYKAQLELKQQLISTVKLVEFLKVYAFQEKIFEKDQLEKINDVKITKDFFDVFNRTTLIVPEPKSVQSPEYLNNPKDVEVSEEDKPTNIIPFDRRPQEEVPTNVIPFDRRPQEEVPTNVIPFDRRPQEKLPTKVAKFELNLHFVDFQDFYGWVLDNSFIVSKLKPSFYIANLKSLALPTREFINSFENPEFVESLEKFCIQNDMFSYSKPTYLIWTK